MKIKGLFMLASIVAISFTACEKDEKDPPAEQPAPTPVDTTGNGGGGGNEPPIDFMASKDSTDRNVYVEIYTGVRDAMWPQTNDQLNSIDGAVEDLAGAGRFIIGVIHQGQHSIDNPQYKTDALYRTDFSDPLAKAAYATTDANQISPYSAGSINRIKSGQGVVFAPANGKPAATVMSVSYWQTIARDVLDMYSSVNIGAAASITNNEIKVDVDLYFTGNEPDDTYIHVALLQDGLLSNQSPGLTDYSHDHVLRDMITDGLNGDPITETTTPGTWLRRNYTYTIPSDYNGPRGGAIVKKDLKVVVYVTEKPSGQIITAKEILL